MVIPTSSSFFEAKMPPREEEEVILCHKPPKVNEPKKQGDERVLPSDAQEELKRKFSKKFCLNPIDTKHLTLPTLTLTPFIVLTGVKRIFADQKLAAVFPALPIKDAYIKGGTLIGLLCPALAKEDADIDVSYIGDFSPGEEKPGEQFLWISIAMGLFLVEQIQKSKESTEKEKKKVLEYWEGGGNRVRAFYNRRSFYQLYGITRSPYGSYWNPERSHGVSYTIGPVDLTIIRTQVGASCISYLDAARGKITAFLEDPDQTIPLQDKYLDKFLECLKNRKFATPPKEEEGIIYGPRRLFKLAREMARGLLDFSKEALKQAIEEFLESKDIERRIDEYIEEHVEKSPKAKGLFLIHLYSILGEEGKLVLTKLRFHLNLSHCSLSQTALIVDLWILSMVARAKPNRKGWIFPMEGRGIAPLICGKVGENSYHTLFPPQNVMSKLIFQLLAHYTLPDKEQEAIVRGLERVRFLMEDLYAICPVKRDHKLFMQTLALFSASKSLPLPNEEFYQKQIDLFFREFVKQGQHLELGLYACIELGEWVADDLVDHFCRATEEHYSIKVRLLLSRISRGKKVVQWPKGEKRAYYQEALQTLFIYALSEGSKGDDFVKAFLYFRESLGNKEPYPHHTRAYRRFLRDLTVKSKAALFDLFLLDFPQLASSEKSFVHRFLSDLLSSKRGKIFLPLLRNKEVTALLREDKEGRALLEKAAHLVLAEKQCTIKDVVFALSHLEQLQERGHSLSIKPQDLHALLLRYMKQRLPIQHLCHLAKLYCVHAGCSLHELPEMLAYLEEKAEKEIHKLHALVLSLENAAFSNWFLEVVKRKKGLHIGNQILLRWKELALSYEEAFAFREDLLETKERLISNEELILRLKGERDEELTLVIDGYLIWYIGSAKYKEYQYRDRLSILRAVAKKVKDSTYLLQGIFIAGKLLQKQILEKMQEGGYEDEGEVDLLYRLLRFIVTEILAPSDVEEIEELFTLYKETVNIIYKCGQLKIPEQIWSEQLEPMMQALIALYPKRGAAERMEMQTTVLTSAFRGNSCYYEWAWKHWSHLEFNYLDYPKHFTRVVKAMLEGTLYNLNDKQFGYLERLSQYLTEHEECEVIVATLKACVAHLKKEIADLKSKTTLLLQRSKREKRALSDKERAAVETNLAESNALRAEKGEKEEELLTIQERYIELSEKITATHSVKDFVIEKLVKTLMLWIDNQKGECILWLEREEQVVQLFANACDWICYKQKNVDCYITKIVKPLSFQFFKEDPSDEQIIAFLKTFYLPFVDELAHNASLSAANKMIFNAATLTELALKYVPALRGGKNLELLRIGCEMREFIAEGFRERVELHAKDKQKFDPTEHLFSLIEIDMTKGKHLLLEDHFAEIFEALLQQCSVGRKDLYFQLRIITIYHLLYHCEGEGFAKMWQKNPLFGQAAGELARYKCPLELKGFLRWMLASEEKNFERIELIKALVRLMSYHREMAPFVREFFLAQNVPFSWGAQSLLPEKHKEIEAINQELSLRYINADPEQLFHFVKGLYWHYRFEDSYIDKFMLFKPYFQKQLHRIKLKAASISEVSKKLSMSFAVMAECIESSGRRSEGLRVIFLQKIFYPFLHELFHNMPKKVANDLDLVHPLIGWVNLYFAHTEIIREARNRELFLDQDAGAVVVKLLANIKTYFKKQFFTFSKGRLTSLDYGRLNKILPIISPERQIITLYDKIFLNWLIMEMVEALRGVHQTEQCCLLLQSIAEQAPAKIAESEQKSTI